MRRAPVILVALGLVLAAIFFAGCGGQKRTIPTRTAESFLRQLDTIGSQFDANACSGAHAKVAALLAQARQLPRSVDPTVRRNLEAGIARLDSLVARTCQKPPQTNTNTTPTVPTQTVPTTTPTNTLPTTTPTQTTPPPTSTTPPTTTTPPPTTGGGGVTVPGGTTGAGGASLDLGRGHGKDHRGNSGSGGGGG